MVVVLVVAEVEVEDVVDLVVDHMASNLRPIHVQRLIFVGGGGFDQGRGGEM